MPCWYFEKDDLLHSPSEADGINFETETRYREEGAGFIIELANKLGIHYDTYATAVAYFHRFYMLQSFRNFHRHVLATSCLLLSGKLNDGGLTVQDLLKTIKVLLSEKQFSVFGSDPQQEIIQTEMSLLETLKFDLDVVHPYAYLLHYTKLLEGEKETIQQLLHMSWTFVNDSLYTTLCVQYEPDLLGLAFLYLACRLTKFEVTTWHGKPPEYRGKWYEHFVSDMNIEILKDICHQVLSIYSRGQNDMKMTAQSESTSDRRMPASPADSGYRRKSLSPLPKSYLDRSPERARHLSRDSSPVGYRSSHSRSQSRYRRCSFSRSPSRRNRSRRFSRSRRHSRSPRRRRSVHKSYSPRQSLSPVSKTAYTSEPSTQFLSRESFEEIQAKLRSGQFPPESLGMVLPPPTHIGSVSEPLHASFGPPGFQPLAFPPPAGAQIGAFPYQSPPAVPPAAFPPRLPEVGSQSQIIVHQPTVIGPPVIGLHPARIPGPGPKMLHIVHPPGMFPDARAPFLHDPRGPLPPDVRGPFMPDLTGPPPDMRGPFLPNPVGPFHPDMRFPFLGDPRGPFPPDIRGSLPPPSGGSMHPDVHGLMPHHMYRPPNQEGQLPTGIPEMMHHPPPFVPGDGSFSNLQSDCTSPEGGFPSSPNHEGQLPTGFRSPGNAKNKKISQMRPNLIYTT